VTKKTKTDELDCTPSNGQTSPPDGTPPATPVAADPSAQAVTPGSAEQGTAPADGGRAPAPTIEPEAQDAIRVGAGGPLVVPREDLDTDLDDGAELDLLSLQPTKIRKPGRFEWVLLNPALELRTRLLPHKSRPDAIETDYYYVDPSLRGPIREEIKLVRVLPYYSLPAKAFGLWVVKVTPGNSWYESVAQLLRHPAEFVGQNAICIRSDKPTDRYRPWHKRVAVDVAWPTKPTEELLGEALGPERFIVSADHPIYRELAEGTELV
jgi:hypothetical protein